MLTSKAKTMITANRWRGVPLATASLLCLQNSPAFSANASELDYVKVAEATDGRCDVVVKREGRLYSIEIKGLEPDERFDVISTSERERIVIPVEVSYKGVVIIVIAPQVKGYDSGVAHIDFESRRCKIHVSYPWRDE
jgi:hypothetical protein